jgi:hypothetical protein
MTHLASILLFLVARAGGADTAKFAAVVRRRGADD